ncbi:MAG: glycosyltransferase family 4 protein [Gammaproteobacteria bacterium]|jgi:UDP-glucose:(heptosyl)LPS alpha-1,3-glucosyltransferase|nr:glycosyltransferase family 4 protein [Gammaproteobacteria bacterium]MBT4606977.1 glycosyltransferase family 4 protein [Thiotrichales bacterium]MBT5465345.1 glycosyltransferase family 4 protein [Candidatus Neomarinimicrobiota bacterium]MBT3968114.1 glycosyltransferase family 4 protein [Gammaproteobacteria bacterium]MBT4081180.1 glycosyltransferase family 4 protein [Gammaproteobacteria bacterium]
MNSTNKKKLRIAVIRQKYTPHGGAERFVDTLLKALNEHTETEVTLITRQWKEPANQALNIIECNPFYLGRLWRDWSFYRAACATLKQHDFDIVQSHERAPCADIYRAGDGVHRGWLHQRQRAQSWWGKIWISISPYHRYILRQERRVFENKKLLTIIANSETIKQEITHYFPSHQAQIVVVPNAVDQEKFHPNLRTQYRTSIREQHNIPEDTYVSLFIGSGYERKGVKKLLEIFSQLPDEHQLIIIGKDKHQEKFNTLSKKMKLESKIHFLGPQQDVRPFIGAADLFVFPSLYDPLPNSTLEAAASGLPVLASNTTGAADLTEAIGISAPDPLDTTAWIKAIKTLQKRDPIQTNDMAPYKGSTMADTLLQLYQDTLKRKHETL